MSLLGIDLAASSKRPSAYAVLNGHQELSEMGAFHTYEELLEVLDGHKPNIIAIDAPLTLPLGLDCLEESCPCEPSLKQKGRTAEVELAHMGIGCFYTSKRSIIKGLVYRGVEFYRALTTRGHQVIEVYPYATKVVLFGDKIPRKASRQGMAFVKEKLRELIWGLDPIVDGLNHDRCDALLAAYTAHCHFEEGTDSLGLAEEGYIVIPKLHS